MTHCRIAIVGAGLAGLSTCYYLLQQPFSYDITLFDARGIGGGASGIAAGLVHSYPGKTMRLSWNGKRALRETKKLVDVAQEVSSQPIYRTGLLRVATTKQQENALREEAAAHCELQWKETSPFVVARQGLYFATGMTVNMQAYLQALWKVCQSKQATLMKKHVSMGELSHYDQIVVAAGARANTLLSATPLPLKVNKGQLLVCQQSLCHTFPMSIIGDGYVAPSFCQDRWYLGSTYEHNFSSESPCLETAKALILKRAAQFIRDPAAIHVLDCKAGLRAGHQKCYHPIIDRVTEQTWVCTGFGSRGLLYHAYLGQKLAAAIAAQSAQEIPPEVKITR